MSSPKPTDVRPADKDEDESDEVLLYPLRVESHPGDSANSATQYSPHSQRQEQPPLHVRGHPLYRSQTAATQHYGYSPTSLHQYALFPALMRSVTPRPLATATSNTYGIPLANSPLSDSTPNAPSTLFEYPEPQTSAPDLPPSTSSSSDTKKYSCHLCGTSFERRYDLKRHMNTHVEQKQFECSRCRKALARNDSLQRHKAACKGPKFPSITYSTL
ncbi:hypothetical protein FRB91_003770 [Serendipita sp. 411]|nr:hypothetical protein FRC18_008015 [Serendipita sp. 400]KAG8827968.1 hypothetical protein FRC19_010476 [Serendipita sp. 401]KAG8861647.1 hypothetical protein FRB91_003770 [Serendipita sp. 411]